MSKIDELFDVLCNMTDHEGNSAEGIVEELKAEFEIYKKHHYLNCPDCCTKEVIIMELENKIEKMEKLVK